jgi:hypothetical protein
VQELFFGWAGENLTMRMRMKVFTNLMRQDAAFFDDPLHATGKICTRLATDAPNVKQVKSAVCSIPVLGIELKFILDQTQDRPPAAAEILCKGPKHTDLQRLVSLLLVYLMFAGNKLPCSGRPVGHPVGCIGRSNWHVLRLETSTGHTSY